MCMVKREVQWLLRVGECIQGTTRLQSGVNNTSGRVEVCVNGGWSTVCDKGLDYTDGRVICRSLGLHVDSEYIFCVSIFY